MLDLRGAGWSLEEAGRLKSQEMPLASSNQQFSVQTKGRSTLLCAPHRAQLKPEHSEASLPAHNTRAGRPKKEPKHAPVRREDSTLRMPVGWSVPTILLIFAGHHVHLGHDRINRERLFSSMLQARTNKLNSCGVLRRPALQKPER